jgi:hypothetical protein
VGLSILNISQCNTAEAVLVYTQSRSPPPPLPSSPFLVSLLVLLWLWSSLLSLLVLLVLLMLLGFRFVLHVRFTARLDSFLPVVGACASASSLAVLVLVLVAPLVLLPASPVTVPALPFAIIGSTGDGAGGVDDDDDAADDAGIDAGSVDGTSTASGLEVS